MESRVAIWVVGMLFLALVGGQNSGGGVAGSGGLSSCNFPAIFNFGDSNSDTGLYAGAITELMPPNGMSYHYFSNRVTDGRLILDYLAESLGLPYLNAPVDNFGTSFKQGANFATGGAKISPIVITGLTIPIHLDIQVSLFLQFKSRTIAFHQQLRNNRNNNPPIESKFPDPEVFSKALYTLDIGQNDINGRLGNTTIPIIVSQFSNSLERLLKSGARYIWVHNTGPHGCEPGVTESCDPKYADCSLDKNGCNNQRNMESQEFNRLLKQTVYNLRAKYPQAAITYVDMYSAKLGIILNAKNLGFHDASSYCCGKKGMLCDLNNVCRDPEKYISWDNTHYTQAANKYVAKLIINGSLSDPPVPLAQACHRL